ncbi:MAG: hypothetical protein LBH13_00345 [Cellulomonadaceae bacterium]|nr:hypothetical protein [Cellulomonadaceae bacterium]
MDIASADVESAAATWDIAAVQDLGVAPRQMAQSSESYVSQYVAHRVDNTEDLGVVVLSRQTMACAPVLPLVAFAIAEGAVAAGTDGFDLAGRPARAGHTPMFLTGKPWPNRVRQHEIAMAGLLSSPFSLDAPATLHIVGQFWPDFRGPMVNAIPELVGTVERLRTRTPENAVGRSASSDERSLLATAPMIGGDSLSEAAFFGLAESQQFLERGDDGTALSYFTADGTHVVRGEKDLLLDRPHGHVLLAGDALDVSRPTLSTTVFAHGIVSSHTVLGNTTFDRLVSVHRNHLNLLRSNGVRVLLKRNDAWQLLGQPSAFILDVGQAQWLYRWGDESVIIRTTACATRNAIVTEVSASSPIDMLITTDLEMDVAQWQTSDATDQSITLRAADGTTVADHHAGLSYTLALSEKARFAGDAPLFADGEDRGTSVLTTMATAAQMVRIVVAADMDGGSQSRMVAEDLASHGVDAEAEVAAQRTTITQYTRGLQIDPQSRFAELEIVLTWWAHDARVHFLVPHGLEQYSGAAWGVRDVCQGPFELLMATGRFSTARDIILRVLARETREGTFPQWFMFDDYAEGMQAHSHGDIPVWPLFALGQYLRATGDLSILDDVVDYRGGGEGSVAEHIAALVNYQATHVVPGTALPAYGEGDWDDTLQPARREMRDFMASSWTSALLYQAYTLAAQQLAHVDSAEITALVRTLTNLAQELRASIRNVTILDGITAGFVTVEKGDVTPVIHPRDVSTGLTYRLIPMTRMMIAGVFELDEAHRHEALIRKELHFPDGVRLTNKPARFADGEIESFLRAEQAAFFGREVGLMYVHAHVRWVEALASLGRGAVGEEILRISPIGMGERVPSALPRQRTCYTSSSDGTFPERYTAARDFNLLRTGDVTTADGWRVYSSGPGIFIRQVLHGLFGLDERIDSIVVAPNLTLEDDGLAITLIVAGKTRTVRYRVDADATDVTVSTNGAVLKTTPVTYPLRPHGAEVSFADIGDAQEILIVTPPGTSL